MKTDAGCSLNFYFTFIFLYFEIILHYCNFSDDVALEEIFKNCSETSHDKTFLKFKTKVSDYPDLIVRFSRNNPLWSSDQYQPSADSIPSCEYCGSPREFEFQVITSILFSLNSYAAWVFSAPLVIE